MSFGTLVFTAFTRNPLRFLFTFAAIVAAFCLFGVLETQRYERATPVQDEDLIVVQPDGSGGFPLSYEGTLLNMEGVSARPALRACPRFTRNPRPGG